MRSRYIAAICGLLLLTAKTATAGQCWSGGKEFGEITANVPSRIGLVNGTASVKFSAYYFDPYNLSPGASWKIFPLNGSLTGGSQNIFSEFSNSYNEITYTATQRGNFAYDIIPFNPPFNLGCKSGTFIVQDAPTLLVGGSISADINAELSRIFIVNYDVQLANAANAKVRVDWGDGFIKEYPGGYVTASHVYTSAGSKTIKSKGYDGGLWTNERSDTVTIINPNGSPSTPSYPPGSPSAPTGAPTMINMCGGQYNAKWNPVATATSYKLERFPTSTSLTGSTTCETSGTTCTATVSLGNSWYRSRACNASGCGPASSPRGPISGSTVCP